jgi:hypothetical protein
MLAEAIRSAPFSGMLAFAAFAAANERLRKRSFKRGTVADCTKVGSMAERIIYILGAFSRIRSWFGLEVADRREVATGRVCLATCQNALSV